MYTLLIFLCIVIGWFQGINKSKRVRTGKERGSIKFKSFFEFITRYD